MIQLSGWALTLGASSGFGEAASLALARAGLNIFGVHLDRKATMPNAERITAEIKALGRQAVFFNVNAADAEKRAEVAGQMAHVLEERGESGTLRVLLHSLAFGTLKLYVADPMKEAVTQAQMDMTLDVMAHSLVYWTQEVVAALLRPGVRGKGGARVAYPPARLRARAARHHRERHPRRRDRHTRPAEDPEARLDHRRGTAAQPQRTHDDDRGRRAGDRRAVPP
jgi:NAD(P)-dependent dehydrogenase (short-subunit alcohol dehydrogenase family)